MTPDSIINVTESNFDYEVLKYSQNILVMVDFWAPWCQPCKVLGPILEKLALEAGGNLRLARVDADENPNLAIRFNVRSLPTVIAFSQGQPASEFVGILPEGKIREFIAKIIPPSPYQLAIEKADSLLRQHLWGQAEKMYTELLEQEVNSSFIYLGLAIALLGQGRSEEALPILNDFPANRQLAHAEALLPYAKSMQDCKMGTLPAETDLDTAFQNSIRLGLRGNLPAALDGLLDLIRQQKHYRDDLARQVFLGILELLGEEDPQTRQYRAELASVLF
jgi:putative thioredoxin